MAIAAVYNFPEATSNDDYNDVVISVTKNAAIVNLTGASIKMCFVGSFGARFVFSTANAKVVITNAAAGEFKILFGKLELPADTYKHDIQITLNDGKRKTWARGKMLVQPDITKETDA